MMSDRDRFAAAALAGMLGSGDLVIDPRNGTATTLTVLDAYRWADAMLREREKTSAGVSATGAESGSTPDAHGFGFRAAVMNWISEATGFFHDDVLRTDDARDVIADACSRCWDAFDRISCPTTNHDAAPAARANAESVAPQPTAGDRSGNQNPTSHSGTGNTWSPLFNPKPGEILPKAVVGFEYDEYLREHVAKMGDGKTAWKDLPKMSALMADWITRTPDWLKDKPQATQPAPPCVETDGFSPGSSSGQINRSAERESPRRECAESSLRDVPQQDNCRAAGGPEHHISDRPQPINADRLAALEELSALDQELELKHGINGNPMIKAQQRKAAKTDTTQPRNGAPAKGSVQGDGSFRDSRNANEPVAWAVRYKHGDTGIVELLRTLEECRHRWANRTTDYWQYEPLYRSPQPTLTDAEREAVGVAMHRCDGPEFRTLRSLLERLGGER